MSRRSGSIKNSRFFGQDEPINCANLVPPRPLMKPVFFDEDLRFLVLDVNACDTDYTHWISPNTTERNVLELYSFLYMLNRIFYHAEKKVLLFRAAKGKDSFPEICSCVRRLSLGTFCILASNEMCSTKFLPACLTLALMINGNHFDARRLFVSPLCLDILKTESWTFDGVKGVGKSTDVTSLKGMNASGVFGSYKTLKRTSEAFNDLSPRVAHSRCQQRKRRFNRGDGPLRSSAP